VQSLQKYVHTFLRGDHFVFYLLLHSAYYLLSSCRALSGLWRGRLRPFFTQGVAPGFAVSPFQGFCLGGWLLFSLFLSFAHPITIGPPARPIASSPARQFAISPHRQFAKARPCFSTIVLLSESLLLPHCYQHPLCLIFGILPDELFQPRQRLAVPALGVEVEHDLFRKIVGIYGADDVVGRVEIKSIS